MGIASQGREALASMSLAPPKHKRQSSADCGSPRRGKESETKDQQNAQLVVSALDLAVEERRLAQFRTRCLVQEDPSCHHHIWSLKPRRASLLVRPTLKAYLKSVGDASLDPVPDLLSCAGRFILSSFITIETSQAYFPEAESQCMRQVQRNKYILQFKQIHLGKASKKNS